MKSEIKIDQKFRVSAVSLGCDKNRVDLEKMLYLLKENDFEIVADETQAELVIVNTCAFIKSARDEAENEIKNICKLKKDGLIKFVIVTGCYPQKNRKNFADLNKNFENLVDLFLPLTENINIAKHANSLFNKVEKKISKDRLKRILTTYPSYAFLKIADGCNNACAYCTIPQIRGRFVSVPFNELIKEAESLAQHGVKEIILVAQDVTAYGSDFVKDKKNLIELLRELSKIKELEWIRLHYCYPEKVNNELLDEIKNNKKICNYIDIPMQHIDDRILKEMNRRTSEQDLRSLVKNIKENYPEITLRTTFIIGFPGEGKAEFKKLCQFVENSQFDLAGFFPYSREEMTKSFFMPEQVAPSVIRKRLKIIQKIQGENIVLFIEKLLGKKFTALIDSYNSSEYFAVGRIENFSPEVDYYVKIPSKDLLVSGEFVTIRLTKFENDYFIGEIENGSESAQ